MIWLKYIGIIPVALTAAAFGLLWCRLGRQSAASWITAFLIAIPAGLVALGSLLDLAIPPRPGFDAWPMRFTLSVIAVFIAPFVLALGACVLLPSFETVAAIASAALGGWLSSFALAEIFGAYGMQDIAPYPVAACLLLAALTLLTMPKARRPT